MTGHDAMATAGKAEPIVIAAKPTPDFDGSNVAATELKQFIERIERLEEEKGAIGGDIKDIYGEVKGRGYDTKAVRTLIRLRRKDANERMEEEMVLQTYMAALGMLESGHLPGTKV